MGCFPFAHHYSGNHYCFLFLRVLRCFSSPGSLLQSYVFTLGLMGFPIRIPLDLRMIGSSPGLFAAFHVLHRLSVPRHSPCALVTCRIDARARYEVLKDLAACNPDGFVARIRPLVPRRIACQQQRVTVSLPEGCIGCPIQGPHALGLVTTLVPHRHHAHRRAWCGSPPRRRVSAKS